MLKLIVLLSVIVFQSTVFSVEITGTGSTIPGPLIKIWAEDYSMRSASSEIRYQGSSPADGIKRLLNKEVDFSCIDMPLSMAELKKNGLMQYPISLGVIVPMVNLPNVYTGQFRLDGQTLGDIFLGHIKKWNDPAIVALNPSMRLPDVNIVIIRRVSPPGVSTMIGDYLAKTHSQWKSIKGDTMAGEWPATSISVESPPDNIAMLKKTPYSIGYGPASLAIKHGMAYVQMKNKAGNFVSPSDDNITAAALNTNWVASDGFNVILTDQPGANTWPISMTSFVLIRKSAEQTERSREFLKYIKYSLRNGGLRAFENNYIPLPDAISSSVRSSLDNMANGKDI
jgi:phosphate transport system substrate-binding protein